jgi:hypothetical protein
MAAPRLAADDELNARRFLARDLPAFGVRDPLTDLATVRVTRLRGRDGSALFRRLHQGLPIFGGEVAVGWRADGAITVVNGSRSPAAMPVPAAEFRVGEVEARAALSAATPGSLDGPVEVERGWLQHGGGLHPVLRIDGVSRAPFGAWRGYVDAGSGKLLYRLSRIRHAKIKVWTNNPLEPVRGAAPVLHDILGLTPPGSALQGDRAEAFNCQGFDLASTLDFTTACIHVAAPDGAGDFVADPDPTHADPTDTFAEQSTYFHTDFISRFFDSLDPAFAAAGGLGFIPSYVNFTAGGGPFDNAFFSPAGPDDTPARNGFMGYGQGRVVDLAYDAETIYHELTHAVVNHTAGFEEHADALGINLDPGAINEGTADTFAFLPSTVNDPCQSRYFGTALGVGCLRNGETRKTCRGDGPNNPLNAGRDGEIHDDGEIWMGFTWRLNAGAATAGEPARLGMARSIFLALQAVGPYPTFLGFAETIRQKALDTMDAVAPGMGQTAADFVSCTIAQRDLGGCDDRSLALYSGERTSGHALGTGDVGLVIRRIPSAQQYYLDVPCGASALKIASGFSSGPGSVYIRHGEPITFLSPLGDPQYDWRLDGTHDGAILDARGCADCDPCGRRTALGAGRWYFLPANGGPVSDFFELGLSMTMADGSAPPARVPRVEGTCQWGGGPVPTGQSGPPLDPPSITCEGPRQLLLRAPGCPLPTRENPQGCGCGAGSQANLLVWAAAAVWLVRSRRT